MRTDTEAKVCHASRTRETAIPSRLSGTLRCPQQTLATVGPQKIPKVSADAARRKAIASPGGGAVRWPEMCGFCPQYRPAGRRGRGYAPSRGVQLSWRLLVPPPGSSPASLALGSSLLPDLAPLHPFLIQSNFIQGPECAAPTPRLCRPVPQMAEEPEPRSPRALKAAPGPTRTFHVQLRRRPGGLSATRWEAALRPPGQGCSGNSSGAPPTGGPTVLNFLPDTGAQVWRPELRRLPSAMGRPGFPKEGGGGTAPRPKNRPCAGARWRGLPGERHPAPGLTRTCRDFAETTRRPRLLIHTQGQVPVRGTWEARAVSESPSPLCDTSQKSHSSPSHAPSQAALRTLPGSWFVPGESPPTVKALESPRNSQGPRRGAWRPRGPRPAPQQDGDMPRAREDEGKACRSSSGHLRGQDRASQEWTDTRHRLAVGTQHLSDNSEQTSHRVTPHTHTQRQGGSFVRFGIICVPSRVTTTVG